MANETKTGTPPYITYAIFDSFISSLAESGVPHQIDTSLLRNQNGPNRSGLMAALRYLGLTDEKNNARPALEKLVNSSGGERTAELRKILTGSYGFLRDGKLDLKRATPALLSDAIGMEGATGGTRVKAVGFLLKAAAVAGIEVSPHVLKHKHAPSTGRRPKRAAKNPKQSGRIDSDEGSSRTKLSERTPYEVLVNDIYDPSKMKAGSEEEKAVFTLARYLKSAKGGG